MANIKMTTAKTDPYLLSRVYAFQILPQKTTSDEEFVAPSGGTIKLSAQLRDILTRAGSRIARDRLSRVDFAIDPVKRHNAVRDLILKIAFGNTSKPAAAAQQLADRLSRLMDKRSTSALLVVVVETDADKRRVSLFLLPHEHVVTMSREPDDEMLLETIDNAFSTGSAVRKYATASGHESQSQFLTLEVLDLQFTGAKEGADFWIHAFLDAKVPVSSEVGTRLLSEALRRAFDAAPEDKKDGPMSAMHKALSGMVKRTSIKEYAENEVPREFHEAFLKGSSPDLATAVFEIDPATLRIGLGRRIIETTDGVVISAPSDAIGKTLHLETKNHTRTVNYEGIVTKEQVKKAIRVPPATKVGEAVGVAESSSVRRTSDSRARHRTRQRK